MPGSRTCRRAATRVTAELSGFATSAQRNVPVALGGSAEIDIQMKLSTQSETITVTAAAPVVDSSSTQVATNYSREWVENAPVRRFTFFDLVNAAPGVSPSTSTSSRSQSFSSATNENMPAGRHRLHRAAHRRGVAVAQHRRHRGGAGALPRCARGLREPRRRGVQRRDAPGHVIRSTRTPTSTSRAGPDGPQHHGRPGRRAALQP
ncbi:MAG: hypothetical protein R2712_30830 [Vicinamibacterales bacterium]